MATQNPGELSNPESTALAPETVTLTVDATAFTVQTIAAAVLGWEPRVTQGRYTTITLSAADADRVAEALIDSGYVVAR